ncbi:hypothetical protein [Streptomyces sirii]|uniref:hypothetical protein n=1 Tax=Streptomyces sirii TaxID=3127701 RepID=UPI003D36BFDE
MGHGEDVIAELTADRSEAHGLLSRFEATSRLSAPGLSLADRVRGHMSGRVR